MRRCLFVLAILQALVAGASARPLLSDLPGELSGYIAFEGRVFVEDAQFPGQRAEGLVASVVAEPEWYLDWNDGRDSVVFVPFARAESDDPERSHVDIRELNYLRAEDDWGLRVGIGKMFWGVTESGHLVDIINQDDAVEDIDGEDKLGQPMVQLSVLRDWGALDLFVLPGFRERTFPGTRGRLRPSIVIDEDAVRYESSQEEWHTDFAARLSATWEDWDGALSHFYGTARDPRFEVVVRGDGPVCPEELASRLRLAPAYDLIHQTGLELQYTGENILLKAEAIGREGQGSYRWAAVGGFEYTFYGLFESDADVGVLAEFHYDSFEAPEIDVPPLPPEGVPPPAITASGAFALEAPPSPFEHDVFGGFRLTLNDVQSTELLAGAIVDVDDGSRFWTVEASRRFGDRVKLSIDLRLFDGFSRESFFSSIEGDGFVQAQLARYF